MDGASQSRRRSDHNISYSQSSQHKYNNSERTDFVGITISDDFSQKQLPLLPTMNNASSPSNSLQQKQPPLPLPMNSQRQNSVQQEPPEGHSRRRLDNYVPNSPSGHYTVLSSSTSQHQNVQHHHQRSLSGHQSQPPSQQSQSYSHIPSSHLLQQSHNQTHQSTHTNSRQHHRPSHSHSQLQQSSGQQQPPPPLPNQFAPPTQIGFQPTYSSNSQPSSPNAFSAQTSAFSVTASQNKSSQQLNQSRTDFGGSKSEYRTTAFRKVRSISDLRPQSANRVDSAKGVVSVCAILLTLQYILIFRRPFSCHPHFYRRIMG